MVDTGLVLIGEASRTARNVAGVRFGVGRLPAPYGDPEAADRLTRLAAGEPTAAEHPMNRYLAARTRFFDRRLTAALDAGIGQVIVAAAGYDDRALRYGQPGVRWFEVDHPDTQADKRARLGLLGADCGHVRFVPADFACDDVAARLAAAGCDPTRRSVVLAEGIAVYLDLPELSALLYGLRNAVPAGSWLVISLSVETDSPERQARRAAFQRRVAALGEPARSTLTASGAGPLLAAAGWRIDVADTDAGTPAQHVGLVTASASEAVAAPLDPAAATG
jgi:methyltransferase (TIGR00027 family)